MYIKNLNRPRKKKRRFVIPILFAMLIFYGIHQLVASPKSITSTSFLAMNNTPQPEAAPTESPNSTSLESVVQQALVGTQGSYAVVIRNLKTGERYYLSPHQPYETGSLYKLWIMATTFQQIQEGILNEDQILSATIPSLNSKFGIATEDAELKEGGITMSVKQALNQMITISHNYAALLLSDTVKLSNTANFLESYAFKESKVGTREQSPITTAADIALFFEKLYHGQLANPDNTSKMITLLKAQNKNNKLPKNLPAQVVIAHKTGEINYFSHDAGIVFTDKGDYIIVVLSETKSPPGAEKRIAEISLAVYKYFNEQ